MYRNWLIGLSVIFICGALGYLYYLDQSKKSIAPLPPTPENPVVNTPDIPVEDREYAEKMKILEVQQSEERVQKINDIELANKAITAANALDCQQIESEITRWMCEERSYEALALKEKNTSHCDAIANTVKKSICNDKIYIIQAKEKGDTLICDMISDEDLRTQCVSQVEMKKYNANQSWASASGTKAEIDCKSFKDESVASQCLSDNQKKEDYTLLSEAMKGSESKLCSDIHDEKIQSDCYDGVYFSEAKISYSLKDCEKIMNATIKTQCITTVSAVTDAKYFQEAIQTQSIESCDKILSTTLRPNCRDRIRLNFIIESWDIDECSSLTDVTLQQTCKNSLWTK